MKKRTKIILIAVPCVLLLALVIVYFSLGSIVKAAVEGVLPGITGTEVTVTEVDIALLSGKVGVTGLVIGNPKGFRTDSAFDLREVRVDFSFWSVFSDTVHIHEIYVDGLQVTYEASLGGSNVTQIRKNVEKSAGPPPEKGEAPAPGQGGKKVVIDNFILKNGKLRMASKELTLSATAPLADLHLKDLGKKPGGANANQVALDIFVPLVTNIESVAASAGELLKQGGENLKGAADGAAKDAQKQSNGLIKGVGDLLKKK